jgi:hypothetical protein
VPVNDATDNEVIPLAKVGNNSASNVVTTTVEQPI